jgi:hypothetical protein
MYTFSVAGRIVGLFLGGVAPGNRSLKVMVCRRGQSFGLATFLVLVSWF